MTLSTSLLVLLAFAALMACLWMYFAFRRDLRAAQERLRGISRIVPTASGPIECAEAGKGPPLLAVHGAGGGVDQGMAIGRPLVDRGFRVIAMSRFGYLRTPLPEDASPSAQADAHASLLDALGVARVAVIGVSAGAPSAMQFAIRHPDRCAALVLLVPLAYKPAEVAPSAPKLSPRAEKILMTIAGSDLAFWLAWKFARTVLIRLALATPPEIVSAASKDEQMRIDGTLDRVLPVSARLRGIFNEKRIADSLTRFALEKIVAPTLVISVRDDLFGTFASAQYTAAQIANAKFVGYETGGHLWVGHHEDLIAEVDAFLRAHCGADRAQS